MLYCTELLNESSWLPWHRKIVDKMTLSRKQTVFRQSLEHHIYTHTKSNSFLLSGEKNWEDESNKLWTWTQLKQRGHELLVSFKDRFRQGPKWAMLHTDDQQIYGAREAEAEGLSTRKNSELKISQISQFIVCIPLNTNIHLYLINATWLNKIFFLIYGGFWTPIQYPSLPQCCTFLRSVRSDCQLYLFQTLSCKYFFLSFHLQNKVKQ